MAFSLWDTCSFLFLFLGVFWFCFVLFSLCRSLVECFSRRNSSTFAVAFIVVAVDRDGECVCVCVCVCMCMCVCVCVCVFVGGWGWGLGAHVCKGTDMEKINLTNWPNMRSRHKGISQMARKKYESYEESNIEIKAWGKKPNLPDIEKQISLIVLR